MIQDKEQLHIPIIIPAYEPDDRMISIISDIKRSYTGNVIIVNDGSGAEYNDLYDKAEKMGCIVLKHYVNQGKGRALKTAFNYCLNTYPDIIGCVTADSDGQHRPEDIFACMDELYKHPDNLIMGCRTFGKDIPWKSLFGNKITVKICKWIGGVSVSDTQTGLRAIPKAFMADLINVPGERFEFETRMLIKSKDTYPIMEVPIGTVYDSKENHQTHFNPIKDSIRIYKIFGEVLFRFIISSLSSFVVDIVLFSVFCSVFRAMTPVYYIAIATVLARIVSAAYNYIINYKLVFNSERKHSSSSARYFTLALIQMACSALFTSLGVSLFPAVGEVITKVIVDTILFIISFLIQRRFVF